jgi:hypothetical protein
MCGASVGCRVQCLIGDGPSSLQIELWQRAGELRAWAWMPGLSVLSEGRSAASMRSVRASFGRRSKSGLSRRASRFNPVGLAASCPDPILARIAMAAMTDARAERLVTKVVWRGRPLATGAESLYRDASGQG